MRAARVAGVKLLIERGRARSPAAALGARPRAVAQTDAEGGPTCSRVAAPVGRPGSSQPRNHRY